MRFKNFRPISLALSFTAYFVSASHLPAQKTVAPALPNVLQRLQENLSHYDQRVPSFFCDEHVDSSVDSDAGKKDTVTDSTFRLKHIDEPNNHVALVESRTVKLINGKPATANDQQLGGPAMLSGAFEGGLAVVSASQASCMKYKLQHTKNERSENSYTIRFVTALTPQNTETCLLQEPSHGSATIDAATMQITHLEITTPHHTIIEGNAYEKPVIGERVLSVDYAPVLLGEETLWMPSSIHMSSLGGAGTFHTTIWSFKASYRNYHKLEVTSHLHAAHEAPQP